MVTRTVTRPQARGRDKVGPVTDVSAGQEGGWAQRGREATGALAETWGGLAEVTYELSAHRMGPAHGVPGLGRQGPVVAPHRDRTHHHGRAGAGVGRSTGRPREERRRCPERGLDRRAQAVPRRDRPRRVRRGDRHPAGPAGGVRRARLGSRRLEPGGRCAPRHVHGGAGLRQLGARARRPPCPRPAGRERESGLGPLARAGGERHAVRRRQAGRLRRRHRCPLRGLGTRQRRRARSRLPSRADGPGRSATRSTRRSRCRSRASTSCASAAAGPRRNRCRPPVVCSCGATKGSAAASSAQ